MAYLRRMSETPTTTTSQKSIAIHLPIGIAIRLQFALQYFWCPYALRKGNLVSIPPICIAVRPPFVLQYASHSYRSTFGKILVVVVTEMFPITEAPGSPRVPKECAPESEKSPKRSFGLFLDSFRTPGRTLWGLWGSPGPEAVGHPFGLFSDSFRTLLGFRARRAWEPSVPGGGGSYPSSSVAYP